MVSVSPTPCACGCGGLTDTTYLRGHHRRVYWRSIPLADRFWPKVNRNGPIPAHCPELGACWPWDAACFPDGYGQFQIEGTPNLAHRVAYTLTHGPIPDEVLVLHKCDNKPCCRPDHLEPGDDAKNQQDAVDRGLTPRGSAKPAAKLTEDQIPIIRRRYAAKECSQQALADEYGVSQVVISAVIRYKIWKHVA